MDKLKFWLEQWLLPLLFGSLLAGALYFDISYDPAISKKTKKIRYSNAARYFGVLPGPVYMLQALQIRNNVTRISRSAGKNEELYNRLESGLRRKWGRKKIARLFGYIDEQHEAVLLAVLLDRLDRVLHRLKRKYLLPAAFVFSALNNEGKVFAAYSDQGEILIGHGYAETGLDWFGSEYTQLRQYGLLDRSFSEKFVVVSETNELNQRVPTAVFKHMGAMFEGFAATLINRQRMVRSICLQNNIPFEKLSDEEVLFWTYFFFNAGGGFGAQMITKLGSLDAMREFFSKRDVEGPAGNAFVVLAAAQWLKRSGAFDLQPEGRYWWSPGK